MKKYTRRVGDEWEDRHENENGDDECTDGISNADIVLLNEEGREDHSHTAQSVCKNVEENSMHVVILAVSERNNTYVMIVMVVMIVITVIMTMTMTMTVTMTVTMIMTSMTNIMEEYQSNEIYY